MKKVLIVDDEFLVRLGIKTTIDWQANGFAIAGEASNGFEALKMIDELDPDVLITDIKMPDMDGLQLIDKVQEARSGHRKMQIIILSNYSDFNYARQAIRFGVSQYILKSEINAKKLTEALKTLASEQEPQGGSGLQESRQEEYIENQIQNMKDPVFPNTFSPPDAELFPDPQYVFMLASCDISQLEEHGVGMTEKMLLSLIEGCFPRSFHKIFVAHAHLNVFAVVPAEKSKAELSSWLVLQGNKLSRNIKQYCLADLSIGYSLPGDASRFPNLFTEAELSRRNCFFTANSITIFNDGLAAPPCKPIKTSYLQIKSGMESDTSEKLEAYIADCFKALKQSLRYDFVKSAYIDFLATAKIICTENKIDETAFPFSKFDYGSFDVMPNINTAEEYIRSVYLQIYNTIQHADWQYSHYIKSCLAFIEKNYSSSITLNDVAKSANISTTYLSLIFKQEMQITFSEYLTNYRIEQAKRLLATTALHIYEIAEKVGFSSPYYFSRVFRSATKLSCKEYRDRFAKV